VQQTSLHRLSKWYIPDIFFVSYYLLSTTSILLSSFYDFLSYLSSSSSYSATCITVQVFMCCLWLVTRFITKSWASPSMIDWPSSLCHSLAPCTITHPVPLQGNGDSQPSYNQPTLLRPCIFPPSSHHKPHAKVLIHVPSLESERCQGVC